MFSTLNCRNYLFSHGTNKNVLWLGEKKLVSFGAYILSQLSDDLSQLDIYKLVLFFFFFKFCLSGSSNFIHAPSTFYTIFQINRFFNKFHSKSHLLRKEKQRLDFKEKVDRHNLMVNMKMIY